MEVQSKPNQYRHADVVLAVNGNSLWLGDIVSAEDVDDLKAKNIKTVITAMPSCKLKYNSSIRHFFLPLNDIKTENISQYFNKCAKFIKEGLKVGSVLVHCGAGVSRSTTLVIAYLIKEKKMTFHEALKLCKSKRPEVCPNLGFQMQLKYYQKCLKQQTMSTSSKLTLIKPREISLKNGFNTHSIHMIYATRRNQSVMTRRAQLSKMGLSKIGFRVTMKEFKG